MPDIKPTTVNTPPSVQTQTQTQSPTQNQTQGPPQGQQLSAIPIAQTTSANDEPLYVPNHPTTQKNKSDLVRVLENVGGVPGRTWRGVCRKCGWQTHHGSKADAKSAVEQHVDRHIAG